MYGKSLNVPEEKCTGNSDLSYSSIKKCVNWEKINAFKLKQSN